MTELETMLRASLEDFALTRAEKKELKPYFAKFSGDQVAQAKARQLAFRLANSAIEEYGQIAAMDWLQDVIKILFARENEINMSAYFSPGDDCLNRIRRLINEAQQTLDICVFTITDDRIVERLAEAHRRGIKIRVISDNDKSEDLGSDLDRLESIGITCCYDRTEAHMHHKFAIADGEKLLSGSYNWTRSAATQNNENIIVTNDPKLLRAFQETFDSLWKLLFRS